MIQRAREGNTQRLKLITIEIADYAVRYHRHIRDVTGLDAFVHARKTLTAPRNTSPRSEFTLKNIEEQFGVVSEAEVREALHKPRFCHSFVSSSLGV
jgi:hypothetical protein